MTRPDPSRPPLSTRQRFVAVMRVAAGFAIVIAAIAVLMVTRGSDGLHLHMLIATALGVGLTVLLGIALMTLLFLSDRHGHDAAAHHFPDKKDE